MLGLDCITAATVATAAAAAVAAVLTTGDEGEHAADAAAAATEAKAPAAAAAAPPQATLRRFELDFGEEVEDASPSPLSTAAITRAIASSLLQSVASAGWSAAAVDAAAAAESIGGGEEKSGVAAIAFSVGFRFRPDDGRSFSPPGEAGGDARHGKNDRMSVEDDAMRIGVSFPGSFSPACGWARLFLVSWRGDFRADHGKDPAARIRERSDERGVLSFISKSNFFTFL
jgi:hypothetical protein